jgi:hypothetical protein
MWSMFDTDDHPVHECLAREFEVDALSGEDAVRVVTTLGVIRRLTEGLLANAAKRVAETSAHVTDGDCSAAQFYARAVGVGAGEAHRVLRMAKKLEALPETAAAVREGRLSGRQAQLVAGAATIVRSITRREDPRPGGTSRGSARCITGERRRAGGSAHPTPRLANERSDHQTRTPMPRRWPRDNDEAGESGTRRFSIYGEPDRPVERMS